MMPTENMLFGSTNQSGSVPSTYPGPVFAPDGKLVLDESFTALEPLPDTTWFEAGLKSMTRGTDFVESWRIWDCCGEQWADINVALYRFEQFDMVVRMGEDAACVWRGSLNTAGRIIASRQEGVFRRNVWQWLRVS